MMSENCLKEVRNQYEEFPYPPVNPEDEKRHLIIPITEALPYVSHYCYGGRKDLRNGCRFLVAGGGTGNAVIGLAEQLRNYDSEIIYLDLSEASQRIARERARIRGLENRIQWFHGSLLSVQKMGLGEFDFINASGVLHHLADPEEGLKELVSILKPDGAMGLMLYAKYGRLAVYQMQEALRLINHDTPDAKQRVKNSKIILDAMPDSNWFLFSPQAVLQEIRMGDAAIYDLLLHSQDRSYSIPELYHYLRNTGLDVAHFYPDNTALGKKQYDPSLYIKDARLLKEVHKLPVEQQQQLAELLNGKILKHTFNAVRKKVSLPDISDPDMVPFMNDSYRSVMYDNLRQLCDEAQNIITLKPFNEPMAAYFPKTPHLPIFLKYLDGQRSMGELLELVQNSITTKERPSPAQLVEEFSFFYKALNEYSWMLLRHKSIPPYDNTLTMQQRVSKMYA